MKKTILLALVSLTVAGCAVSLKPGAKNIRITSNPNVVKDCKFIANIEGDSDLGGLAYQNTAGQSVANQLKNKALEVGADTVFADIQTSWGGTHTVGEAYLCAQTNQVSQTTQN